MEVTAQIGAVTAKTRPTQNGGRVRFLRRPR